MAKGKNKAFKLKEYKVPQDKYLVVVNPWGLPERFDSNTKLNEIAAWFELLLRKEYPDGRVGEIFYQKTHRNIIVELPREVDINKYLGAYRYSDFHKNISPTDSPTLYIYEYRFATFGNPSNKNWTGIIPTNTNIPVGLLQVLKDPFPLPSPAPRPPSDTPYARPIPQDVQNILSTKWHSITTEGMSMEVSGHLSPQSPAPAANVASCSYSTSPSKATGSLFTTYEPPSHYVSHVEASKARIDGLKQVKLKMDPYEEEEVEKSHLRSLTLSAVKDESNEAVKFLDSFLSNVKSEEVVGLPSPSRDSKLISRTASTAIDGHGEEEDYKPSADLLALFNTLDQVIVKSEVDDEGYRPSDELVAALANLSDNTESYSIKHEPADFKFAIPQAIKHERNSEDDDEAVLFRKRLKREPED